MNKILLISLVLMLTGCYQKDKSNYAKNIMDQLESLVDTRIIFKNKCITEMEVSIRYTDRNLSNDRIDALLINYYSNNDIIKRKELNNIDSSEVKTLYRSLYPSPNICTNLNFS